MNEIQEFMRYIVFSNVINDIVVIMFFVWLFRKFNLLSFIGKKRKSIIEKLISLEHDKRLKESQLEITRERVKNIDKEVAKIKDDGEQVAAQISERIVEEAEKEAANMQKKAHLAIESEQKIATNEVLQEVATSAFTLAEAKINESIDENLHKKYIDNFIDNLEKLSK